MKTFFCTLFNLVLFQDASVAGLDTRKLRLMKKGLTCALFFYVLLPLSMPRRMGRTQASSFKYKLIKLIVETG